MSDQRPLQQQLNTPPSGFNSVSVIGDDWKGFINLCWNDHVLALVPPPIATEIREALDAGSNEPAGFRFRLKSSAPLGEWSYIHHREPSAWELGHCEIQPCSAYVSTVDASKKYLKILSTDAPIIRDAYEVLFGCLSRPEIAQHLDVPTVERIAKRLNGLLPVPGRGNRTSSVEYRAELYDEIWSACRDLGYANATMALEDLVKLKKDSGQQSAQTTIPVDTWAVINLLAGASHSDGLHDAAIVQTARGLQAASEISNRLNDLWAAQHPDHMDTPPPYCCCVVGAAELAAFEERNKAVIRYDTIPGCIHGLVAA